MPKVGNGRMRRRKAGESMRKIMQEMVFRSHPTQTLYTALVDAMRIYGRGRKLVEDMRQTEYSYNALLKMTLVLGLLVRRISARGEAIVLFTTDPTLTRERLQEAAHSLGSAEISVPRQILNVQQIPLLGTGKVNYVKLKEEAGRADIVTSGA